jgi:hypothetical protein
MFRTEHRAGSATPSVEGKHYSFCFYPSHLSLVTLQGPKDTDLNGVYFQLPGCPPEFAFTVTNLFCPHGNVVGMLTGFFLLF